MTTLQLATTFNAASIAIVLAVGFATRRRHGSPVLRHWILAHAYELVLVVSDLLVPPGGLHPAAVSVLQVGLIYGSLWHMVQVCAVLGGREQPWHRGAAGAVAFVGAAVGMAAAGVSHVGILTIPLLLVMAALTWMGGLFILDRQLNRGTNATWIGLATIARAWVGPIFFAFAGTELAYASFAVGAVLHLVVGIGMVLFLTGEAFDALKARHDDLHRIERLKGTFLNVVGHELRTPLAVIEQSAYLAAEADPGARRELLATVREKVHEMERMVRALTDYAQLEAGVFRPELTHDDLGIVVEDACRELAPLVAATGHRLDVDVADAPMPASYDRGLIGQVVANLVLNAAKFAPPGTAIALSLRPDAGEALLAVADEGPGIPPDQRAAVFAMFHQADASTSRRHGGLGIGLALCRRIVEDVHGGRIWVEAAAGGGALVRIALPLDAARMGEPPPEDGGRLAGGRTGEAGGKVRAT